MLPSGVPSPDPPHEPEDLKPFSVFRQNSQAHRSQRGYRGVPSWWGVGFACHCAFVLCGAEVCRMLL